MASSLSEGGATFLLNSSPIARICEDTARQGIAMLKVVRWIIFEVIISVLPLGFAYVDLTMKAKDPTWAGVIGNGELLVIVWAISAGAIGELFGSDGRPLLKVICGGLTLLVIISATHFFSAITEARASNVKLDDAFVVSASVKLFIFSLAPSLACLAITG